MDAREFDATARKLINAEFTHCYTSIIRIYCVCCFPICFLLLAIFGLAKGLIIFAIAFVVALILLLAIIYIFPGLVTPDMHSFFIFLVGNEFGDAYKPVIYRDKYCFTFYGDGMCNDVHGEIPFSDMGIKVTTSKEANIPLFYLDEKKVHYIVLPDDKKKCWCNFVVFHPSEYNEAK